ncbi:MAG TPA: hypothetical protein VFE50_01715 [Cyclobacteriaceae bacterium]|nr:hypothetical protein [Cyclobacteriaceae bacterium]
MKTQFKFHLLAAAFLFSGTVAVAGLQRDPQEEVPGDNFSLEGALELFKKSASPQEFEQLLNSPDSKVNNLDLNGDGEIDYVRVIDRADGNIHTFTLQALVSSSEAQDIAVIELEKRNDGSAVLQIVGDADIYGIETIIEPTEEVRVNAGASTARTVVNVWAWPSVQYVYGPAYNVWISPWRWSYYPGWYRPWRPVAYYVYDPWWRPYRPYYSVCYSHRVVYAPRIYRPYRTTSVIVYNRHSTQISNYRSTRSDSYARGHNDRSGGNNQRYNRYDANSRSRYNSNPGTTHSNGSRSYNNSRRSDDNATRPAESHQRSSDNTGVTRQRSATRSDFQRQSPTSESRQRSYSAPSRSYSASGNNGGGSRQRSFSAPSNNGGGSRQRSFSAPSGGSRQHSSPAPSHSGGSRGGSGNGGGGGGGGGGSHGRRH